MFKFGPSCMLWRPYMLVLKSMPVASVTTITSDYTLICNIPNYAVLEAVEDTPAKYATILARLLDRH
jgi:hypothetical protein